jgi:metal-responsive CopG/Arc/MetJ family transcriptional regulator
MTITKRATEAASPDAKPARWQRGNRTQITISLAPELLDQLDQVANRKHLNRSAMLTVLIGDALARDERAA